MARSVLVVDDSPSVRRLICATLRRAGYETVEAGDGSIALDVSRGVKFAAVITDQNMPNLDGIGFIRAFRAQAANAGIPVIFLSTENETSVKQKAREAGAIGWMTKPFDEQKLLSVMTKLVG